MNKYPWLKNATDEESEEYDSGKIPLHIQTTTTFINPQTGLVVHLPITVPTGLSLQPAYAQ